MNAPISPQFPGLLDEYLLACLDVFGSLLSCVLLHGSAFKGAFIPGYSDLDLVVLMDSTCFSERGAIRDDLAFAIQARAGGIPWPKAGVAYPQVLFRNVEDLGNWWVVPDSYKLLYGTLPGSAIGTEALLQESAQRVLREWLPRVTDQDIADFAEVPDEHLPRRVRLLGTRIKPVLFSLLTLTEAEAGRLWTENLDDAMGRLAHLYEGQPGPGYVAEFYKNVRRLFAPSTWDVELARTTFRSGIAFLRWAEVVSSPAGRA